MKSAAWLLFPALLVLAPAIPAAGQERIYTCINNADSTTTCVSSKAKDTLTCTAAGGGVVSCSNPAGDRYNCVLNTDSTVSCRDPDSNEQLDCVGLGMGENACERRNPAASARSDVINSPGLFNKPLLNIQTSPIPGLGLPEVIELPSAFQ